MSRSFPITGVPFDPRYPLPERQDVDRWFRSRIFRRNAYQLSLFVRALSDLMNKDPDDELSFFAIAGIHDEPIRSWDGVQEGSQGRVFCAHANPTFPTWHRPYLLLIEQVIHTTMKDILRPYQNHGLFPEWESAADTWRLPYWDWATSRLPDIVVYGESIPIRKLLSATEEEIVRNPFWQFNIPGGKSFAELGAEKGNKTKSLYSAARATSKWAITELGDPKWKSGVQNWDRANQALDTPVWRNYEWRAGGSIGDAVERLFSPGYHISWESFASTKYNGGISENMGFMNLEYIHNNIHGWTGGSDTIKEGAGHMSTLAYSAFDPVFWLHHCNVDRLTSIWLLLNPDKFFDNPQSDDPGIREPLAPFHRDTKHTAWTSADAQSTKPWNYSYDVLHQQPRQENAEYLSKIRKTINELYGQSRKDVLNFPEIDGKKNDYILDIIYDRYGLNGNPYTIHFFLGPVDGDPSLYSQHPNRIGILYTFSSNLEVSLDPGGDVKPKCENCAKQKTARVLSRGQVVLTSALLKDATDPSKPDISSLEPEDVTRYLARNLNWRVVDNLGTEIDIEQDLPQTKIFALKGVAEHYEDSSELSKYYGYSILPEPCVGKPGGVGSQPEL